MSPEEYFKQITDSNADWFHEEYGRCIVTMAGWTQENEPRIALDFRACSKEQLTALFTLSILECQDLEDILADAISQAECIRDGDSGESVLSMLN